MPDCKNRSGDHEIVERDDAATLQHRTQLALDTGSVRDVVLVLLIIS